MAAVASTETQCYSVKPCRAVSLRGGGGALQPDSDDPPRPFVYILRLCPAGHPGEELEPTFLLRMWRTDWPLFVPSPLPAEFPEVAEGLSEPLGCSSWGNPLVATSPALESTLPTALRNCSRKRCTRALTEHLSPLFSSAMLSQ